MNCLGLTAFCRSSGATSWRTYSPGNEGRGGLASVFAMAPPLRPLDQGSVEHRGPLHVGGGRLAATLLEGDPQRHLEDEHRDVDGGGDDVAERLERHEDASPAGG